MAGVSVLSGSGDPSGDNTIRVRGINSITAETGPLVVIDGFIGGPDFITFLRHHIAHNDNQRVT